MLITTGDTRFVNHPAIWAGDGAAGDYATTPWTNLYPYSEKIELSPATHSGAALLIGSKWTSLSADGEYTTISYSFATANSIYSYPEFGLASTLKPLSEMEKAITRRAMDSIEAVARIRFVEVEDRADQVGVLRYAYSQKPAELKLAGLGFYPSSNPSGGDIWLVEPVSALDLSREKLILHETLHAIGLKHPFDGATVMAPEDDIIPNTVMSYSPLPGAIGGRMAALPGEPMVLDIVALQDLYGANGANTGDTVYDLAAAEFNKGFKVIWDSKGTDTLDASGLTRTAVSLNLADGARSKIGVSVGASSSDGGSFRAVFYTDTLSIAVGAVIENAIGTAKADTITGNATNNRLAGHGGSDTIDGAEGVDVAIFRGVRGDYEIEVREQETLVRNLSDASVTSLTRVERLEFNDSAVALDLNDGAALVAKLIAAIYGIHALGEGSLVGAGLRLLGQGLTPLELADAGLINRVGADYTAADVLDLLFANVAGRTPTSAEREHYLAGGLDANAAAELAVYAADVAENIAQIDLVGLAQHGLVYLS